MATNPPAAAAETDKPVYINQFRCHAATYREYYWRCSDYEDLEQMWAPMHADDRHDCRKLLKDCMSQFLRAASMADDMAHMYDEQVSQGLVDPVVATPRPPPGPPPLRAVWSHYGNYPPWRRDTAAIRAAPY